MTNLNSPKLYGPLIGIGAAAVIFYLIYSGSSDKKPKQYKFPFTTGEDANLKAAKDSLSNLNPGVTRNEIKSAISRTFSQNKPLIKETTGGKRNKRRSKKIIKKKK
jgi:hypothetical protein